MTKTIDSFSGNNRFLSNFYMTSVRYQGVEYPSSEHAYQAAKVFADAVHSITDDGRVITWRDAVRFAPTAGKAKKMGSREGIDGKVMPIVQAWDDVRFVVMTVILVDKFKAGSEMAEKLLATGDADLIEGNHWGDVYWGVCNGKGENNLGKILMRLRADLKDRQEEPLVGDLSDEDYARVEDFAMQAVGDFVDRLKDSGIKVDLFDALTLLAETAPQYPEDMEKNS